MIIHILVIQSARIFEGEREPELQVLQKNFYPDSHAEGLSKLQSSDQSLG